MSTGEFQLIERHFTGVGAARADVVLGVGDDAALVRPGTAQPLRVACASASPDAADDAAGVARACYRDAVAQLAGAGAVPAWATLALSLDPAGEDWVARFATALRQELMRDGVALVGGDTTAGATCATVFLTGAPGA